MRRKGRVIGLVLVLFLALAAGFFFLYAPRDAKPARYRTARVERGDVQTTVSATGTLNPVSLVLVGSQVSGRIEHLYADFNSLVKQGQVVAQLDPDLFEAQVAQARANLDSAQANLRLAEVKVRDTERTLTRRKGLLSQRVIAQSQYDEAEAAYDSAVAQREVARAQLSQAEAALALAQTNLAHTVITSPVDGVVISRHVDIGQTVAASFQTPVLFTIGEDLSRMQLNASVDEADIGQVASGQAVTFTVDAYPEETFAGRVSQVRNAPNIVQNVVTYDVIIQVSNPRLQLKPGMTANVSILVAQHPKVLRVPNAALRFRPPSLSSIDENHRTAADTRRGPSLWTLDPDGQPRRVEVEPGITDGSFTELKNSRLREGQEVIVEALEPSPRPPSEQRGSRFRFPYGRPF